MDAKTLEALQGSIQKWEGIVAGTEVDGGSANCPLCKMFYSGDCDGCPVFNSGTHGHHIGCTKTPYISWRDHHQINHQEQANNDPWIVLCPECKKLAQDELDFLKSLLRVALFHGALDHAGKGEPL